MSTPAAGDPDEPKVTGVEVKRLDVAFTVDFECNLSPTTEETLYNEYLSSIPLPGKWSLEVQRGGNVVEVTLEHGHLEKSAISSCADTFIHLYYRGDDGAFHGIASMEWPVQPLPDLDDDGETFDGLRLDLTEEHFHAAEEASSGTYSRSSHRQYRLCFTLKHVVLAPPVDSVSLAKRNPDTTHTPIPNNVRLFFPYIAEQGAELWTTSHLLSSSSPYLQDLLASHFSESVKIGSKRARTSPKPAPTEARPPKDFEDSDDDTDATLFEEKAPTLHDLDGLDFTYRQITVTHAAYSTYRAVLRYLATGLIRFAPLTSSCLPTNPSANRTRRGCIDHLSPTGINPSALLVSPKSVYRLAHLLQLEDLQQAALAAFKGSLSPANAAAELFDIASVLYGE